jgi:hypothetical protein
MSAQYFALIADETGERLWLRPADSKWSPPRLAIAEKFWWQDVAPINRAAREQLGLAATTLSCVRILGTEAGGQLFYVLEPQRSNGGLPSGGRWIGPDSLDTLAFACPEHRAIIADWLNSSTTVPWYRAGWREGALNWASEQLTRLGRPPVEEAEQVRSWERSSLWRFRTASGAVYFKAVTETFAHEPRLTQALAAWHPGWFPPVLAVEAERRWMLMGDAGEQTGQTHKDVARWEAGLRVYAEMQVALAERVNDLLLLGTPDRRLNLLAEHIEALAADTAALKNSPAGLSDQEIAALRQRLPEVLAACRALAAGPIPATLEHGDFAPGQIVCGYDGGCRFIDWSDCSVSFPFFGAQFFWDELEGEVENAAEARLRLREAYLQPWAAYAPRRDLMEIFELAMRVAPFYYAAIYHRAILPRMAHKWEMERMLPYYLRIALREPC